MRVEPTEAFKARVAENLRRHRRVLNRLESHLGCIICRGPLTEGVCPACDPLACDLCGGTEFEPWGEDPRRPECASCHHVCAHVGSPMNTTEWKP